MNDRIRTIRENEYIFIRKFKMAKHFLNGQGKPRRKTRIILVLGMDIILVDIMTVEILSSIWVATKVIIYRSARSSRRRRGYWLKGVDGEYRMLAIWTDHFIRVSENMVKYPINYISIAFYYFCKIRFVLSRQVRIRWCRRMWLLRNIFYYWLRP